MSQFNHPNPNLASLMNRQIVVETRDGSIIAGKLTGVEWLEVDVMGNKTFTPKRIIFNADPSEFADWERVQSIRAPA
jgi:hypothetical protein